MALSALCWAGQASAYRPFVGTDAAVTESGQVEIELGPAELLREGSESTLIAPALRLNYGFADRWEIVWEWQGEHGLSAEAKRTSLVGHDVQLKTVLREGSLQNETGPSIAMEFGPLLPGINDEHGTGATLTGIISQRWPWMTMHLNVESSLTRDRRAELFLDTIIEGPHDWTVRPVAEVFHDRVFGRSRETSGLIGAIWQVRDNVAVDAGLRWARFNGRAVNEVDVGITFSFR